MSGERNNPRERNRRAQNDERILAGRAVAVFGGSEPLPGSPLYEEARRLGERLARAGARVISGGYGGVMEAASRGARDAGGESVGVTGSFFSERAPNRWLSEVRECGDLFERTKLLIDLSDAFIILPGKSGTLAEVAFLWALDRARQMRSKPVVLCGRMWVDLVAAFERAGVVEEKQRAMTTLCENVEEAIACVGQRLGSRSSRETS